MTDSLSPQERSRNMSAIRSKGMKPEKAVRSIAHRHGYRFRLHRKDLPGKPDMVFPSRKKVIFVHGCFWHQHDDPACRDGRVPKSRLEYWLPKLRRNRERDTKNIEDLENAGWQALVIWECETRSEELVFNKLRSFLEQ